MSPPERTGCMCSRVYSMVYSSVKCVALVFTVILLFFRVEAGNFERHGAPANEFRLFLLIVCSPFTILEYVHFALTIVKRGFLFSVSIRVIEIMLHLIFITLFLIARFYDYSLILMLSVALATFDIFALFSTNRAHRAQCNNCTQRVIYSHGNVHMEPELRPSPESSL